MLREAPDGAQKVTQMLALLGRKMTAHDLDIVGRQLSLTINRDTPYSRNYIRSVAHGTVNPGRSFMFAVDLLTQRATGQAVQVGQPEERVCECTAVFIPNTPRRIRCYVCSPPRR